MKIKEVFSIWAPYIRKLLSSSILTLVSKELHIEEQFQVEQQEAKREIHHTIHLKKIY